MKVGERPRDKDAGGSRVSFLGASQWNEARHFEYKMANSRSAENPGAGSKYREGSSF